MNPKNGFTFKPRLSLGFDTEKEIENLVLAVQVAIDLTESKRTEKRFIKVRESILDQLPSPLAERLIVDFDLHFDESGKR